MGLGNDARWQNGPCFETFPFPDATAAQQSRIRDLAEQIDAHRRRVLESSVGRDTPFALSPSKGVGIEGASTGSARTVSGGTGAASAAALTLTGMYNVLEKLRSGEALSAKNKLIHEQGLVSVLCELHDALDTAVFDAYGWNDLAASLVGRPGATTPLPDKPEAQAEVEEELLRRLVELNAQRAAEEARGLVRWLRPDYQNPGAATAPQQVEAELGAADEAEAAPAAAPAGKLAWPKNMREQVAAVRAALARQSLPPEAVASQFKRSPKAAVLSVIEALEELGMVQREGEAYRLQG
ncbi:hypothetical protein [Aromatoleum evansii]|uniref:hypothetical protein n=1 Tax=Aromatoleum evansii TaxID=59406 RepID=UPI001FE85293|nr:hypothetical protein [Aromatoleum evansii]